MTSGWLSAGSLDRLHQGKGKLVRVGGKKIALFRVGESVFATENACPHEGYPLAEGAVRDGVLTCNWHNWKFQLDGGVCLYGGENVRVYPVEIREGEVFVDVTDPPVAAVIPGRRKSLMTGIEEMDTPRIARDVVRLLRLGVTGTEILFDAAAHGAERAEYGWNHALAVVADCGRMAPRFEGLKLALPLTQACRAVSEENLRLPPRPHPGPVSLDRFSSSKEAFHGLRDALENDRLEDAEALFRGALQAELPGPELARWLFVLATDHFLDFGHGLIYVSKAFEMAGVLSPEIAPRVFPCLIPRLHYGTREDLLPTMRSIMKSLHGIQDDLPIQAAGQADPGATFDEEAFRKTLLDGSSTETFEVTRSALDTRVGVDRILDATVLAASERLLRFDPGKDWLNDRDYGWLDVTHNLTYANAARKAIRTVPGAATLRAVYFATWFVNRTRVLDSTDDRTGGRGESGSVDPEAPASEETLRRAIHEHDLGGSMAAARAFLSADGGRGRLETLLLDLALEDGASAQIFVDHLIKTTVAALEESARLRSDPSGGVPLVAVARFLAADRRERAVQKQVNLAIDFVVNGKPAKTV